MQPVILVTHTGQDVFTFPTSHFSVQLQISKKIPVSMLGVAAPGEGYFLSRVQFVPDSVTVYAAKKLLDSIQTAYTVRQEVVNFTEPQEITVQLRKIRNAKLMPNKVKMKLFPDVLTEETVEVPVEAINVPPKKVMRIFPRKIKVNFAIGAQRVKSMPKNIETKQLLPTGFKVVVDYNEVADHASEKCHVYIQATTLSTTSCFAEPFVEKLNSATFGSMPATA